MIKVIKRKTLDSTPAKPPGHLLPTRVSAQVTVNEWIEERRRNQIDSDASSRETIARWTAATDI